jgi:hypothetical protein
MEKKSTRYENTLVGIAWYRPEQWQRLREISVDREDLEDTYRDWVRSTERAIRELNRNGLQCTKVAVEVEDLLQWCQSQNIPVSGEARSRYVTEKLQSEMESNKIADNQE